MLVVGLTGGIGSGKSTAAKLFAHHGVTVIDADAIARSVIAPATPVYQAVVAQFGQEVVADDGQIDRQALKKIVFNDAKQRQILEAMLHPSIIQQMHHQAQQATSAYCIMAIPLLLETKLQHIVDRVLVIDVTADTQIARAQLRDDIAAADVRQIMQAQVSRAARLAAADDIIHNDGNLDELEQQVNDLHRQYMGFK